MLRRVVCGVALLSMIGCAADVAAPQTGDEIVLSQRGKADTTGRIVSLGASTPEQVARVFADLVDEQLDKCLDAHPGTERVTAAQARTFTVVGRTTHQDAKAAILGLLKERDQSSISIEVVREAAYEYARSRLARFVDDDGNYDGTVAWGEEGDTLDFGRAYRLSQWRRERSQLRNPEGLDIAAVREAFKDAAEAAHEQASDTEVLTVAVFVGAPYDHDAESDVEAIQQFLGADEEFTVLEGRGEEALTKFKEDVLQDDDRVDALLAAMRNPAIVDTFLFNVGEDGSGSYLLVVVDNLGQLWGFQVSYFA